MRRIVLVTLLATGCSLALPGGDDSDSGPPVISHVEHKQIPLAMVPKIDILFVIDSAPSMLGEGATVDQLMRSIPEILAERQGGLPDFHVAIVDSDLGTLGVDVGDDRCVGEGAGGRIETFGCGGAAAFFADEVDDWGNRVRNYSGDLSSALSCVVTHVGAAGCPWRQPLEAMRRALDDGERTGFLRPEAVLQVVFLGDADDCSAASIDLFEAVPRLDALSCFAHAAECSATGLGDFGAELQNCRPRTDDRMLVAVEDYRADLLARKDNPSDVRVAAATPLGPVRVIRGPALRNSCDDGVRAGTPAVRLQSFLTSFTDRNVYISTCEDGWTEVMTWSELIWGPIGYPCIDGRPIDTAPGRAGLQPEIAAWITRVPDLTSFSLPDCAVRDGERCYRLVEDRQNCTSTPTGLELTVEPPLFNFAAYLNADIAVE